VPSPLRSDAGPRGSQRPALALLTRRWTGSDEATWYLRQIAGALAHVCDVHVVTLQGSEPRTRVDSVFTVHELAAAPDTRAEARRDVLLQALGTSWPARGAGGAEGAAIGHLLDEGVRAPWTTGIETLRRLQPSHVVLADYRQLGAMDAIADGAPQASVALVPLVSELDEPLHPHYHAMFERADVTLVATEAERRAVAVADPARTVVTGFPVAANQTVWSEPFAMLVHEPFAILKESGHVTILTGAPRDGTGRRASLARLLRLRLPDRPVAIVSTDSFDIWHRGECTHTKQIERRGDLDRLMAWSTLVVDLQPGPFLARNCVTSLLYGTPVLVPSRSRAREHVEDGGGLWFDDSLELLSCAEALLADEVGSSFGEAGGRSMARRVPSTEAFVDAVLEAAGLAGPGDVAGATSLSGGGQAR